MGGRSWRIATPWYLRVLQLAVAARWEFSDYLRWSCFELVCGSQLK